MNRISRVVLLAVTVATAPAIQAQTSTLYLASPSKRYTLQGGVLTYQGPAVGSSCQGGIAVYGDIRTNTYGCGNGAQYTLAGTYTGTNYFLPGVPGLPQIYDGTTDGTYNYAQYHNTGNVYRMDRSWQNATFLYDAGAGGVGISYDVTTNSLWTVDFYGGSLVRNLTFGGVLLSQFDTPHAGVGGLAFDAVDNTLWMWLDGSESSTNTFFQYAVTGELLQTQNHTEVLNERFLGAEFDESNTAGVPEPASVVLLATGLAGIVVVARRRKAHLS